MRPILFHIDDTLLTLILAVTALLLFAASLRIRRRHFGDAAALRRSLALKSLATTTAVLAASCLVAGRVLHWWEGSLAIGAQPVATGLALLAGLYLTERQRLLSGRALQLAVLLVLAAGIAGAWLGHLLLVEPPGSLPKIFTTGGWLPVGAALGAAMALRVFSIRRSLSYGMLLDLFTPALLAGTALCRIGSFLTGNIPGLPTTGCAGMVFPAGTPAGDLLPRTARHPAALYEAAAALVLLALITGMRRYRRYAGEAFVQALTGLAGAHLLIDPVRHDGGIGAAAWVILIPLFIASLVVNAIRLRRQIR